MNINNFDTKKINSSIYTSPPEKVQNPGQTSEPNAPNDSIVQQSTSVSLSGRALMLSRLFRTTEENFVHLIPLRPTIMAHGLDYLTSNDLNLISDMYAFAQESGADLRYVDTLASTIGFYRQLDNGKNMSTANGGGSTDSEGHILTYSFNEKDTATAKRILEGDAFKTTQVEQDFLRFVLDPGRNGGHREDFEFLEQMVSKFSAEGDKAQGLDARFSTFAENLSGPIVHRSAEPKPGFGKKDKLLAAQLQETKDKEKTGPSKALEQPEQPKSLQDIMRMLLRQALSVGTWHTSLAAFLMRNKD